MKQKLKINLIIFTLFIFLLSSCWGWNNKQELVENEDIKIQNSNKKPFYIDVKSVWDFDSSYSFKKSWRITWVSDFEILSQVSWRVWKINFREWDRVSANTTLLTLQDSVSNYYLQVERSQNSLDRAKITKDSNILTLQRAIDDSLLAYNNSKLNFDTLTRDLQERINKAKFDLEQASLEIEGSSSYLDIKRLENELQKAKSDYENSLLNEDNNLESIFSNIKSSYKSIDLFYFDLLNNLDEIFWVSEKNRNKNNSFEIFLSARNSSLKNETENLIRQMFVDYENFKKIDVENLDWENAMGKINIIFNSLSLTKNAIDTSKQAILNSVESSSFPQSTIDSYYSLINWYWNTYNNLFNQLSTIRDNLRSFLNTLDWNRKSRLKSISLLEDQIKIAKSQIWNNLVAFENALNRTKIDAENSLNNAKNSIESARIAYNNAISNKEVTLRSLDNQIKEAEIALSEARTNIANLTIRSPNSGVISEVLVNEWQNVSPQTPLFRIINEDNIQVELFLTRNELEKVNNWDRVWISYNWQIINWQISRISNVATSDLTFRVFVDILDKVTLIWDFVDVIFYTNNESISIPVNIVSITWEQSWLVFVYNVDENTFSQREITLWSTKWWLIEVVSWLDIEDVLIINDISNFNETDFFLELK